MFVPETLAKQRVNQPSGSAILEQLDSKCVSLPTIVPYERRISMTNKTAANVARRKFKRKCARMKRAEPSHGWPSFAWSLHQLVHVVLQAPELSPVVHCSLGK